jgi:tape measure domain-containing protein
MAANSKDVDLVIRAKDLSTKVLDETQKAIDEVTSALGKQDKAADSAEKGMKSLSDSAKTLAASEKDLAKTAQTLDKAIASTADNIDKAVARQDALASSLDKSNAEFERAKQTAQNAALAYQIFSNDILAVGPPTKQLAKGLASVAAAADTDTKAFATLANRIDATTGQLAEAVGRTNALKNGLQELQAAGSKVAAAQAEITKSINDTAAAAERATNAVAALNARQATIAAGRAQIAARQAAADARAASSAGNLANSVDTRQGQAADRNAARAAAAADAKAAIDQANKLAAAQRAAQESQGQKMADAIEKERAARVKANLEMDRSVTLLDKVTTGNRESLSWYQRVRGELVALATAYVGLQGAVGLAGDALDAVKQKQAVLSQLAVAAGTTDPKVVGAEYDYISKAADRLGLNLTDAASSYAKFAVAAKSAGATSNQSRYIFEKVAESTKVLNLSAADTQGVFLALEQMLSKGTIQAEELRGQLGDRLPGALGIFAKSTGRTLPQLSADLKAGTVQASDLLKFATGLGDAYGKQLPGAIDNLQSSQNRLQNATDKFKRSIAENGFEAAYTKFIKDLTDTLNSEQGQQWAKGLSDAFSTALTVGKALLDNLNLIIPLVEFIFGAKIIASAGAFATKMLELQAAFVAEAAAAAAAAEANGAAAVAMTEAELAAANLQKRIGLINKVFLGLTAFLAGWEIGKILSDKFEIVRLAGTALTESLMEGFINVRYGLEIAGAAIAGTLVDIFDTALNTIQKTNNKILGGLSGLAKTVGLDSLGDTIAKSITTGVNVGLSDAKQRTNKALADAKSARTKALAENKAEADQQYQQDLRRKDLLLKTPGGPGSKATQLTDTTGGIMDIKGLDKPDKGAEKRYNAEQSLMEQLNALYKQEDANLKTSLSSQLDAVDKGFNNILTSIKKYQHIGGTTIGGESIATVKARVEALKQAAELTAQQKFDTDELTRRESALNDVIKQRKDFEADVLDDVKNGTISAADGFKKIADNNAKVVPQLKQMADLAAQFADSIRGEGIPDTKIDAFIQKVNRQGGEVTSGPNSDAAQAGLKAYGDQLAKINDILNERNALVTSNNDLVQLGVKDQATANDEIKKAYADTKPVLDPLIQGAQQLLQAMSDTGDIAPTKLAALSAALQQVAVQSQYVDQAWAKFRTNFTQALSSGAVAQVDNLTDSIFKAVDGTESWGDAFKSIGSSFAQFIGQFLRQMADAIAQIYATKIALSLLNFLPGGAGTGAGGTGIIGALTQAGQKHSGGVIGNSVGNVARNAPAAWFAAAPRYHSGTVVGLKADEQTAILQKGEEVLSKDNPRNIMNITAANSQVAADKPGIGTIRNVLVTDPNFVPDAVNTPAGEQTLITMISRNKVGFKQALGVT